MGLNDRFSDVELEDTIPGIALASGVLVLDANKAVDEVNTAKLSIGATGSEVEVTASPAEINRLADVSTRIVTLVETGAIVLATHEGKILLMGEVGGDAEAAFTLPAATGSGAVYTFVVSVVNTSGYKIQVTTTDIMQGAVMVKDADSGGAQAWPTASDSDTITLNGTTTGGVSIGDIITLIDILSGTWAVSGQVTQSGVEATMFSAAVGA